MGSRVLVVGFDGATFQVIRPLLEQGKLPNFRKIMEGGISGELLSVPNMISAAAWTSFATGKNPGKHGIFEFYERLPGAYQVRFLNAADRHAKSLWRLLSDQGLRVGVINVPMTYPCEKVNGFLIGGFEAPGVKSPHFSYPDGLYAELVQQCGGYILEPGITSDIMAGREDRVLGKLRESIAFRQASVLYLMQKQPWDFFSVVFRETDSAQHCCWKYYDTTSPHYEREQADQYGDIIPTVYQRLDEALGALLKKVDNDTLVLVVSDHGFGFRQYGNACLNDWLENEGLLRYREGKKNGLMQAAYQQVEKRLGRKSKEQLVRLFSPLRDRVQSQLFFSRLDWANTKAFADNVRETIYLNVKGRDPQGVVSPEEYEPLRDHIIGRLLEVRDVRTGHKVVDKVWRREEIYSGHYVAKAPDLLIRWRFSEPIWGLQSPGKPACHPDFPTQEQRAISGDHRPEGIFIAYQPGREVNPGREISGVRLEDIAPTVLQALGQPIPEDMDGRVLSELFGEDGGEVTYTAAANDSREHQDQGYSAEEEEKIRQRLRALGYID